MNTRINIAVSVLIGFGLGAISIHTLHAQAQGKPPVYLVSEIDVTDPDAYGKEFRPESSGHRQGIWRALPRHRRDRRSRREAGNRTCGNTAEASDDPGLGKSRSAK
jgi:hypothetical protein